MKRIRINKDIAVTWSVTTNGEAVDLYKDRLTLIMIRPDGSKYNITDFSVNNYTLYFNIPHEILKCVGVFRFELWQDLNTSLQTVVDKLRAFELVSYSTLETGTDNSNLTTDSTALLETSSLNIGQLAASEFLDNFVFYNILYLGNSTIEDNTLIISDAYIDKENMILIIN